LLIKQEILPNLGQGSSFWSGAESTQIATINIQMNVCGWGWMGKLMQTFLMAI